MDLTTILAALGAFATPGSQAFSDSGGANLTIAPAIGAGLISFLRPCAAAPAPACLGPATQASVPPLHARAATALAGSTGTIALGSPDAGGRERGPGTIDRLGRRLVGRGGLGASFGLGAIFAIGWTPCIGIILGGILTLAATSGSTLQGGLLLVAYTVGLGLPFVAIAAVYDRPPGLGAPLWRRGRLGSGLRGRG